MVWYVITAYSCITVAAVSRLDIITYDASMYTIGNSTDKKTRNISSVFSAPLYVVPYYISVGMNNCKQLVYHVILARVKF